MLDLGGKMVLPGLTAVIAPVIVGFGLGAAALGGMLAGANLRKLGAKSGGEGAYKDGEPNIDGDADPEIEFVVIGEHATDRERVVSEFLASLGDADGPRLDQLPDLGKLLALAVLAHAGDRVDVAVVGPGGLLLDVLDGTLAVDGRFRVRTAGDRGASGLWVGFLREF